MISRSFVVVILLYLCSLVCSDFFTAMIGYEPLLVTHRKVIRNVDKYVKEETARLINLERYVALFKEELSKVSDVSDYLGNPINCYILIKRLSLDYDYIEDKLTRKTTLFRIPKNVTFPTNQDLQQAAFAVGRLQVFYNLNVTQVADGLLRTNFSQNREVYTENFTPLSFDDCFQLARTITNRDVEYKESIVWLLKAFQKYKAEDEQLFSVSKSYILNLIVVVYDKLANDPNIDEARDVIYENIIMWTKKIMDIETNQGDLMNWSSLVNKYHKRLTVERSNRQRNITNEGLIKKKMTADKRELVDYKSLCQGETAVPEEVAKRLRCRYLTWTHPFLRLAPIKLEQLYINPDLQILHDVIGEKEIQHLKQTAKLEILQNKTYNDKTGDASPPNNRITKEARVRFNTSGIVKRISQRIADITGLNMVSAEDLQVANYGIGGYYDPHFDFADNSSGTEGHLHKKNGDKIATILFYLSDVTQGGATVFLHLGVTVFPVKGAALLWRNLLPSGEVDHATRHAACPVLRGDKWVSTAWIHTHGQELLRPCDLEYQNSTIPPRLLHRPVLVQKKKEQRKQRRRRVHILM